VTARFYIDGADPVETTTGVPANPDDSNLNSTINFQIPGAVIKPGMQFGVGLLQPTQDSKGPNPGAHYPAEGYASTNTQSAGATLKIVLVPIAYGGDGSNRLPDTSPAQLQGYKDLFYAMYPAPAIDLTVRDQPVQYNQGVSSNGSGWDQLLNFIGQVRANDNAPFEAYYYGIFSPSDSINQFCGGGCVAGLGNIGPVSDEYSRHAIGLGFGGGGQATEITLETAVHEIGHTHGRYHSPCGGAAGADPQYPYQGAIIGTWGYNLVTQQLYGPNNFTDVMGYCQPIWVSDYTFKAFFDRVKGVNNANLIFPPELMDLTYDRARVDAKGHVHWDSSIKLKHPPQALDNVDVTVHTGKSVQVVKAQLYTYDHLPGGTLLWPQAGAPASSVTFKWEGATKTISR
jgi:Peptidase M66